MKKKILLKSICVVAALIICISCKENELDPTFKGESRALIGGTLAEGAGAKSILFSFSTYNEDVKEIKLNLLVQAMGNLSNKDRTVSLIIDTNSTALENEYIVPTTITIPAGDFKATVPVILKRSERLKTMEIKLALRVVKSDDFLPGPPQEGVVGAGLNPTFEFNYTDVFTKPAFWDAAGSRNMNSTFGVWSITKHRLMVELSGIRDFSAITQRDKYVIQGLCIDFINRYLAENGTPYLNEREEAIGFCNNCL
jgi:hypothetical protein